HVLGGEGGIELRHQLFRLLSEIVMQPKRLRHPPSMMRHDPGRGIDGEGHDLFGPRARNLLDLHSARGRNHEGDARAFAVDECREIELAIDGRTFLDIEAVDLLAVRARLMGDEHRAEQALSLLAHVLPRLHPLDAPRPAPPPPADTRLAAAATPTERS